MSDTKTEIKYFSIAAWKKEESYLRKQHNEGWEFVKVNGIGCYHLKKCEPLDVIYQLDYNSESDSQKSEYVQLFQDCGWEYLQNYVGYSYFRKNASEMDGDEEEIFCDDASRLDMLKRVFWGRMVTLWVIFAFVIIPQIVIQFNAGLDVNYVLALLYSALFVVYLGIFISFAIPYQKYYKSVHQK